MWAISICSLTYSASSRLPFPCRIGRLRPKKPKIPSSVDSCNSSNSFSLFVPSLGLKAAAQGKACLASQIDDGLPPNT